MKPKTWNTVCPVIYASLKCPDCGQLKSWPQQAGLAFKKRDLSDPEITEREKPHYGARLALITVIGYLFTKDRFEDQMPQIEGVLKLYKEART